MLLNFFLDIELSSERFEKVDPKKDVMYYAKVKVILLTPQCTRTAVANPIEFMLNEGDRENYHLLKDLSHGRMHKKAVEAGLAHTEQLKAALHCKNSMSLQCDIAGHVVVMPNCENLQFD